MPFPAICPTSPAVGTHLGGKATGKNGFDAKNNAPPIGTGKCQQDVFQEHH
ncbi:hypothetical protein ANTHELSMS3_02637 [Antarctobacter heliothermus]|uniref:Uncharacterized protein n=1 Tax=Antarctobacter heliothermus TaxID=74033 RepID=A0A222E522_9RHOB|nr:hypothetical protein ANTHELSMS3_02637 [Antarctobacter heliothermus]